MHTVLCLFLSLLLGQVAAHNFPLGITNCGLQFNHKSPPQRIFAMDQDSAEFLFALNLTSRVVGVSAVTGDVWPEVASLFDKITIFGNQAYATVEDVMSTNPDMILGFYPSAFSTDTNFGAPWPRLNYDIVLGRNCTIFGDDGLRYCRRELHAANISTYLEPHNCEKSSESPESLSLSTLYDMIWELSSIFDVLERGRDLIDRIDSDLADVRSVFELSGRTTPVRTLWFDSLFDGADANVVACCGSQSFILKSADMQSVTADLGLPDASSFFNFNISTDYSSVIVEKDPEVIIFTDATYSQANDQLKYFCTHPVLREMEAVRKRRFVFLPFNAGVLGARVGQTARGIAEAAAAVLGLLPLNSDTFSAHPTDKTKAVAESGVYVQLTLPVHNNVDLDALCPGRNDVRLGSIDRSRSSSSSSSLSDGEIAGIVVGVIAAIIIVAAVTYYLGLRSGSKYKTFKSDEQTLEGVDKMQTPI